MTDCLACRRTEVVNLLESAGFSRANPYYVVQQGKVCRLPVPAGFRVSASRVHLMRQEVCTGCRCRLCGQQCLCRSVSGHHAGQTRTGYQPYTRLSLRAD